MLEDSEHRHKQKESYLEHELEEKNREFEEALKEV